MRPSHRFYHQMVQLALLLSAPQATSLFLLPPCHALQPLFFICYQPASTTFSLKTWTVAFLSLIFSFYLQGIIFSYIFNLHTITDVSQTCSEPTLLVILVHLSHSSLQIKYLKVISLLSYLNFSLFRFPIIKIKIFIYACPFPTLSKFLP